MAQDEAKTIGETILGMYKEAEKISKKKVPVAEKEEGKAFEAELKAARKRLKQMEEMPEEERRAFLPWGPIRGDQLTHVPLEMFKIKGVTVYVAEDSDMSVLARVKSRLGTYDETRQIRPGERYEFRLTGTDKLEILYILGLAPIDFFMAWGQYVPMY